MAMKIEQVDDVTVVISDDEGPIPNIDGELDSVFRTIDTLSEERKRKKGKKVSLTGAKVIPTTNKGFEMLKKMGYKMGSGIGRCNDGITEPLCLNGFSGRVGLGFGTEGERMNMSGRRIKSEKDLGYFVTGGNSSKEENKTNEIKEEEDWDAEYSEPVIKVRENEPQNAKRCRVNHELGLNEEAQETRTEEERESDWKVYKVRIVSQNSDTFTYMQYRTLLNAIQKAVDRQESKCESQFPRFHTFKRTDSFVYAICDNKFTLNWLRDTVRSISSMYKNSKFRVVQPQRGTPEKFFVEMSVKHCYTPGYLLGRIMKQNPKLCTDEWSIESAERDGMNKILKIGIDEKSFGILSKMNFDVFFNLRKIRLKPLL